jgi:hypothetical protein
MIRDMSVVSPARPPDDLHVLRHLEAIEAEAARHRQNAFRVRLATMGMLGGYVALHAAHTQPRYMFVAPALVLGAWLLDAHAEFQVRCLRWLAAAVRGETSPRPPWMSLDVSPFEGRVSWRSVLLRPARAAFFQPFAMLGGYIAVDAPRLDVDGVPSELFWYLAVTFTGFLVLVGVAWSWWLERFGSYVVTPSETGDVPSRERPFPSANGHASPYGTGGPFPPREARRDDTHPFGTAVG